MLVWIGLQRPKLLKDHDGSDGDGWACQTSDGAGGYRQEVSCSVLRTMYRQHVETKSRHVETGRGKATRSRPNCSHGSWRSGLIESGPPKRNGWSLSSPFTVALAPRQSLLGLWVRRDNLLLPWVFSADNPARFTSAAATP